MSCILAYPNCCTNSQEWHIQLFINFLTYKGNRILVVVNLILYLSQLGDMLGCGLYLVCLDFLFLCNNHLSFVTSIKIIIFALQLSNILNARVGQRMKLPFLWQSLSLESCCKVLIGIVNYTYRIDSSLMYLVALSI